MSLGRLWRRLHPQTRYGVHFMRASIAPSPKTTQCDADATVLEPRSRLVTRARVSFPSRSDHPTARASPLRRRSGSRMQEINVATARRYWPEGDQTSLEHIANCGGI